MNIFLIIILNRVYIFLVKVKNQSPLFGAIILVTLLFGIFFINLILLFYMLMNITSKINPLLYFLLMMTIFILLAVYSSKYKKNIKKFHPQHPFKTNALVITIFLLVTIIFIGLANVNRKKLAEEKKTELYVSPQKESLEGKIRKWFDER